MERIKKIYEVLYSHWMAKKYHKCGKKFRIKYPSQIRNSHKISIGDFVSIGCRCWLNCIEKTSSTVSLKIGKGCQIGRFAHINAYNDVVLDEYVLLADHVHISDVTHRYDDPEIPIVQQ